MKKFSLLSLVLIFLTGCQKEVVLLPNSDSCEIGSPCMSSEIEQGYQVGQNMPNVELTTLDGEKKMLYDLLEGKEKIVLSLQASWCEDCHRQNKKYVDYMDELDETTLVIPIFTSFSKEDDPEKVSNLENSQKYMQEMGYEYEAYYDTNDQLWNAFNAYGTPTNIVLDSQAKIKAISLEYDLDILLLDNKEEGTYFE